MERDLLDEGWHPSTGPRSIRRMERAGSGQSLELKTVERHVLMLSDAQKRGSER